MAILNATPDSFSGDGAVDTTQLLIQAEYALENGADILDVGGESTKPGSAPVTAIQEQERITPAIKAVHKAFPKALVSIDTYRAATAKIALDNGAQIINDISGGQDPAMLPLAGQYKCPIILMHNTAQKDKVTVSTIGTSYDAVSHSQSDKIFLSNLINDLKVLATKALSAGISKQQLILDPGIGFGKTVEQNLIILRSIKQLKAIGYPILIGASRKSFIGQLTNTTVENRLSGSLSCALFAHQQNADYLRVHDIAETKQALTVWDAI